MSVDRLRDSASTRSQQRGDFKGEGYRLLAKPLLVVRNQGAQSPATTVIKMVSTA